MYCMAAACTSSRKWKLYTVRVYRLDLSYILYHSYCSCACQKFLAESGAGMQYVRLTVKDGESGPDRSR